MTLMQLIVHLLNFILPALALAVLMPLAGRWVMGPVGVSWRWRCFWHALLGTLVLMGGLVLQGSDGQMGTYGALVLATSTLEWAMHRHGRRSGA